MARTIIQGDLPMAAVVKGNTVVVMTDAEEIAPGVFSVETQFIPYDPATEGPNQVAAKAIRTRYTEDEELATLRKAVAYLMDRSGISLQDVSDAHPIVARFIKYNNNNSEIASACDTIAD